MNLSFGGLIFNSYYVIANGEMQRMRNDAI